MWLAWNAAAALAPVVAAVALWARRRPGRRMQIVSAFARETAIILVLYALWQLAGRLSVMQVTDAVSRGR